MKKVLMGCAVVLIAGCVSVGTKVDPSVVAGFKPGVTTLADAERQLGQPNNTTTMPDGSIVIVYAYTHAQASGSSYIPLVGAFVGHSDSNTTTATLTFDRDGKFKNSTTSQGQASAGMFNHS